MISSEDFLKYIKAYQDGCKFLRSMDDAGLDFYDTVLAISADTMFQAWLEQITNEEGQDLVYWWLFEDVEKDIYEDNKVIAELKDEESLYSYMKENGLIKD